MKTTKKSTKQVLASNKDKKVFFNELLNPSKPNKTLIEAAGKYKSALTDACSK
jgi:hypothetical protein